MINPTSSLIGKSVYEMKIQFVLFERTFEMTTELHV